MNIQKDWWKVICVVLLMYTVVAGFLIDVPKLETGNLDHTARNLYFHVPMWFAMTFALAFSVAFSIMYLNNPRTKYDFYAVSCAEVGIVYGLLGIVTGAVWANFTWGEPWHGDVKQNLAAIALLIYFAYFVLRGSLENKEQAWRISAVYNIFAFALFIPLIFVLPRLWNSIHPGNGGNPGFNAYDLNGKMRQVFYPAVVGFTLLAAWLAIIRVRLRTVQYLLEDEEDEKKIEFEQI